MSQERLSEIARALSRLGFTELEATIYCYLVENSPATPYRVSQDIGKPVANTYKTVQALYQKGLVMIDETNSRLCQAIPPAEVLGKLKASFLDRHDSAERALAQLRPSAESERIFALGSAAQVFERCRKMIAEAESIVLVDAFPGVVEILKKDLESAAKRKVTVVLQAYTAAAVAGVEVIPFQSADKMLDRWGGNWLIVVVDGAEYLFAYMSDDGRTVHNAIWCASAFLALPQHSNLAMSLRASLIEQMLRAGAGREEMENTLKRTAKWLVAAKRGYRELATKFPDNK